MSDLAKRPQRVSQRPRAIISALSLITILFAAAHASPARAEDGSSWWTLHSLDSRGTYLAAGASYARWDKHTINTGASTFSVEYEDIGQFHFTLGTSFVARLLRIRYEIEYFQGGGELTVIDTTTAGSERTYKGDAAVYSGAVNVYYDTPPFFSGRLTPYVGIGGILMGVDFDIDFPEPDPATSQDVINRLNDDLVSGLGGDAEFAYGYGIMLGARIELSPYLALDVGYRFADIDAARNRREGRFIGNEFHETRASLLARF